MLPSPSQPIGHLLAPCWARMSSLHRYHDLPWYLSLCPSWPMETSGSPGTVWFQTSSIKVAPVQGPGGGSHTLGALEEAVIGGQVKLEVSCAGMSLPRPQKHTLHT